MQRQHRMPYDTALFDDLADGLLFFDLLGNEPLQGCHRGEDLLAERQLIEADETPSQPGTKPVLNLDLAGSLTLGSASLGASKSQCG